MLVVLFNNLPQLIGLLLWSTLVFWLGRRWERWRNAHHFFHRAPHKETFIEQKNPDADVRSALSDPVGRWINRLRR